MVRATQAAKRPSRRSAWADQVFDHIPGIGSEPLSGDALAKASNLTTAQVQSAVAYIRDNYPEFPLISSPDGYYFSMDLDAMNKFRRARMKSALTTIRRTWSGAVKPYLDRINNPIISNTLHKQYKRLMEDMGELVR